MKKNSTLFYVLAISILSSGCSNKKCVEVNAHEGLYNALTCNYDSNIQELEVQINAKMLIRNKLFHNYQRLIAQTTNKQDKINQLNQDIHLIENDINSILTLVNNIKTQKATVSSIDILKLKTRLKKLNMNILNKSTFFDVEDALYTNKKLLVASDKQIYAQAYDKNLLENKTYAQTYDKNLLEDKKYAQAYNKNLLEDKKYAQAYDKLPSKTFSIAYKKDIVQDKQIRTSFSSRINHIKNSITTDNLSASKSSLISLVNDIEKYKNSLKES